MTPETLLLLLTDTAEVEELLPDPVLVAPELPVVVPLAAAAPVAKEPPDLVAEAVARVVAAL